MNAHQVIANGMPRRAARATSAPASTSHQSAKPITGTPYSGAKPASALAWSARRAPGAASARLVTAVVDCPSGPSTRNSVGVSARAGGPYRSRPATMVGSSTSVASRLSPNCAEQTSSSVARHWPAGRCEASGVPVAAATIGATTGSSHTGEASRGPTRCWVIIRYGMPAAASRPTAEPTTHSAPAPATAAPAPTRSGPTASSAIARHP